VPAFDMSELEPTFTELETVTFRQAQRLVAGQSVDADECRLLLAMLGIPDSAMVSAAPVIAAPITLAS
jgi:hypothetical protein